MQGSQGSRTGVSSNLGLTVCFFFRSISPWTRSCKCFTSPDVSMPDDVLSVLKSLAGSCWPWVCFVTCPSGLSSRPPSAFNSAFGHQPAPACARLVNDSASARCGDCSIGWYDRWPHPRPQGPGIADFG